MRRCQPSFHPERRRRGGRRWRVLPAVAGTLSLLAAATAVWWFAPDRGSPGRMSGTPPAPRNGTDVEHLAGLTAGAAERDHVAGGSMRRAAAPMRTDPPAVAAAARGSLGLADPWVIGWLRAWDDLGAGSATLEDELGALLVLLMTGHVVEARFWHQRLLKRLEDPSTDREQIDPVQNDLIRVLHLLLKGLVESALGELLHQAGQRPLSGEQQLLKIVIRREMSGFDVTGGWMAELIALAREDHRGAALARLQLLRMIQLGTAASLPAGTLHATGDPRLIAAARGTEVDPPLRRPDAELAAWLRTAFHTRADESAAFQLAVFTIDHGLAGSDGEASAVVAEVARWARELTPAERPFVAEWLAQRGAWQDVRQLLHPGAATPVPPSPRSLRLYSGAMSALGLNEPLAGDLKQGDSPWPEPLILLWNAEEALAGRDKSRRLLVEGMLRRAGRLAENRDPAWVFEFARTAFMAGLPETGHRLLLQATSNPATRERALSMLLERAIERGDASQALYLAGHLQAINPWPGPFHGLWLWLRLMCGEDPGTVLAEAGSWLESAHELRQSEARFIAAMAALASGERQLAKRRLPGIDVNRLPARFVAFYPGLAADLGMTELLVRPPERRIGQPPIHFTAHELAWLEQWQGGPGGLPADVDAGLHDPASPLRRDTLQRDQLGCRAAPVEGAPVLHPPLPRIEPAGPRQHGVPLRRATLVTRIGHHRDQRPGRQPHGQRR